MFSGKGMAYSGSRIYTPSRSIVNTGYTTWKRWRSVRATQEHLISHDLVPTLALLDDVAAAEQQQCGLSGHLPGADDGGARGALVHPRQRIGHHELAELLNEAMVAPQIVIALGCG